MTIKYFKGRLYSLKIADLQTDPNQARKFVDPIALNELSASIQKLGVMTPIQFRQNEESAPSSSPDIAASWRRARWG